MIIDKLSDKFFLDFAKRVTKKEVDLYCHNIKRDERSIKLDILLGGESEDERKFVFKDTSCDYFDGSQRAHGSIKFDVSQFWVVKLIRSDELTDDEKVYILNRYNSKVDAQTRMIVEEQEKKKLNPEMLTL